MIENVLEFLIDLLQRWRNRESLKTLGGAVRSKYWARIRRKHLDMFPNCALCGGSKLVEVHHIQSFHEHPELECEMSNLITLCESGKNGVVCHRFCGHLGNYQKTNKNVVEDAKTWNAKLCK